MYFRNMRLWRIDEERYKMWKRLSGQSNAFAPRDFDADERSKDGTNRLVKTLLANAAVARMFWQIALPLSRY